MANEIKPLHHERYGLNRDYIAMTGPLLLMAFFFYGPRVLAMALVAVVVAQLCDRLASLLRSRRYDKTENSSTVMALVIVLLLPATAPYRVVVAAVLVAILVAKEAFGGAGSFPFNPAAVGFCVVAVSWPADVLHYPAPTMWPLNQPFNWEQISALWTFKDATLVEGPSAVLKHGALPAIDDLSLFLGDYAGPLGLTPVLVILACGIYLVVKQRVSLSASLTFLGVAALIAFLFPRIPEITFQTWPVDIPERLNVMKYEMLSGGMLFGAVFLVSEPTTLPRFTSSRLIYGTLLGIATMMFRYFGIYDLGTCFALLIVNAASGPFDRVAQRRLDRKEAVRT